MTTARDETGPPPAPVDLIYDAFISYSRGNFDEAEKVETDLEKFPLPRDIRKQLGRRHLNVFRDVSDITGNVLDSALDDKLQRSRALIVLCSPEARRSKYVAQEIHRFAELRDVSYIVPVLIAGGPNNDPAVEIGEWAFPDALVEVLGGQPLAADLQRDWKAKRRKAKVSRGSPWVQMVAGIVGSTTDNLTDRIAKDERRRLQSIAAVAVVIAMTVGASAVFAWNQRNEARDQRNKAIALGLTSEGEAMLADMKSGGDVRALKEILAAPHVTPSADAGAQFSAAVELANTIRIIETRDGVNGLAISPDGHRIAAAVGTTVCLWDTETGQSIGQPITGHREQVTSVAFSPDGRSVASGSYDNTVRIWDADTGRPISQPITGHREQVTSVAFSPDGRRIASGSYDKTIRIWDADSGLPVNGPLTGHTNTVNSVAFSPDGHSIASGSDDNTVRLWNSDNGQLIGQPLLHPAWVLSVAWSPDGRRIATGGADFTVRQWNRDTGQPIGNPMGGHESFVSGVAFSSRRHPRHVS